MQRSQSLGVIALGATVYAVAPIVPEKYRGIARVIGGAIAGFGAFKLVTPARDGSQGSIVGDVASGIFGPPADAPAPDAIFPSIVRPVLLEDVENLEGNIGLRQFAPQLKGAVQTGLFSNDYTIRVGIVNTSDVERAGPLVLRLDEDFLLSDESRTVIRNVAGVKPRSLSVFDLTLAFSRAFLTRPSIEGVAEFDGKTGLLSYTVET